MSALVRTEGLFWRPHGCNIAHGKAPVPEVVAEVLQSFFENFSAAAFCCRRTTASCTFVRQIGICPTKVLALRGRAFSRVERLSNPKLWILTKKEHSSPKHRVISTLSGSMKSRISASTNCSAKPDRSINFFSVKRVFGEAFVVIKRDSSKRQFNFFRS